VVPVIELAIALIRSIPYLLPSWQPSA